MILYVRGPGSSSEARPEGLKSQRSFCIAGSVAIVPAVSFFQAVPVRGLRTKDFRQGAAKSVSSKPSFLRDPCFSDIRQGGVIVSFFPAELLGEGAWRSDRRLLSAVNQRQRTPCTRQSQDLNSPSESSGLITLAGTPTLSLGALAWSQALTLAISPSPIELEHPESLALRA